MLEQQLEEAYKKGYVGRNVMGLGWDCDIFIHRGAGAYEAGEETALLESLEGKRAQPRLKPPFPASAGLYGSPTAVNNVETLCNVPSIMRNGAEWYAALGPEKNGGPKLYCVSGHVQKPGVYEASMKVTLRQLIYDYAGGIRDGRALKAVIPGGSSVPILLPDQLDIEASFDGVAKAGSLLGSAGIIVLDDTTCMVWLAENLLRFYRHESCGKCTPCREGTQWVLNILEKIERGEGEMKDLALLENVAGLIAGKTLCAFGDAAATPALTTLKNFRGEYEAHMREGRCTVPAPWRRRHAAPVGSHSTDLTLTLLDHPVAIAQLAILGFVFFMLLSSAAIMVYVERKVAARIQQRMGPTLVGPYGLLQPLADIIKLAMKENLQPKSADPILFALAPIISAATAFMAFAVVPFGAETTFFGLLDQPVPLQVADVNVAILWVFAVTSMGVYGIVLAGWSSNSKYSLLGALRSSAQMISYELSYGMALAAVLLLAGSMSIREIVDAQSGSVARIHSALVRVSAADRVLHLHDGRRCRDQSRAVRFSRSGAGARRRLSHRVQQHELRHVLPGGVHQHGDRLGDRDEPVSRRLARPAAARCGWDGSGSCSSSASCCSSTCGCDGRCRAIATIS